MKLIRVGSSVGGARSKALVARSPNGRLFDDSSDLDNEKSSWILKFDGSLNTDRDGADPKAMPRVEYIYSLLAKECLVSPKKSKTAESREKKHSKDW